MLNLIKGVDRHKILWYNTVKQENCEKTEKESAAASECCPKLFELVHISFTNYSLVKKYDTETADFLLASAELL